MDNVRYSSTRRLLSCAALSALLFAPNLNAALLDQWGTFTQTSGYSCDADPCGSFSLEVIGPTEFAPQSTSADSVFSDVSYGSAEAHATLSVASGLNMPDLRARASGNSGAGTLGVARGVDAYTYNGNSSTTLDLVITLTGTLTNPANAAFTRILADVYIMDADQAEAMFSLGGDSILLQNSLPTPNQASIGLQPGNPLGIAVGVISFDVNPGDSFYLLANLATQAFDLGTADSMNSLTMAFTDESGLVAASAAVVPLPAAAWLFGSGLLGLLALARSSAGQRRTG